MAEIDYTSPKINPVTFDKRKRSTEGLDMKAGDRKQNQSNNPVSETAGGGRGREAFIAEARGRRGQRSTKTGNKYTSGKYKGMTIGEADGKDMAKWRKMPEGQRDKFRKVTSGDYKRAEDDRIKIRQGDADFARSEAAKTRAEVYAEKVAQGGATGGGNNTPYTPPNSSGSGGSGTNSSGIPIGIARPKEQTGTPANPTSDPSKPNITGAPENTPPNPVKKKTKSNVTYSKEESKENENRRFSNKYIERDKETLDTMQQRKANGESGEDNAYPENEGYGSIDDHIEARKDDVDWNEELNISFKQEEQPDGSFKKVPRTSEEVAVIDARRDERNKNNYRTADGSITASGLVMREASIKRKEGREARKKEAEAKDKRISGIAESREGETREQGAARSKGIMDRANKVISDSQEALKTDKYLNPNRGGITSPVSQPNKEPSTPISSVTRIPQNKKPDSVASNSPVTDPNKKKRNNSLV